MFRKVIIGVSILMVFISITSSVWIEDAALALRVISCGAVFGFFIGVICIIYDNRY